MSKYPTLLSSIKVGEWELPNRMIMAPLTRVMAVEPQHIANDAIAKHYADRASAGLLIAEATMIDENQSAFWTEPGIYDDACVEGWKKTTDAVHRAGGRIVLQIWHPGRVAHTANSKVAVQPFGPSAIRNSHNVGAEHHSSGQKTPCEEPRALADDEIPGIIDMYVNGAKRAIEAGFDGVEIHGANGYLLDQFWKESTNKREGPYGGSVENRAKLHIEVTPAVAKAIGPGRVGIRLSPLNSYNDMKDSDPVGITAYLASKLNEIGIAYIHIMRADFFSIQNADVVTPVRENFKGTVISNMGYELDEADKDIAAGKIDAVAFGFKFLANPDLVERARVGAELNAPNPATFYTRTEVGYNDYPRMGEAPAPTVTTDAGTVGNDMANLAAKSQ